MPTKQAILKGILKKEWLGTLEIQLKNDFLNILQ